MNTIRPKQNITMKSASILQGNSSIVHVDIGNLATSV